MIVVRPKACRVCEAVFQPINNRVVTCSVNCRLDQYTAHQTNGCIQWTGGITDKGYGEIRISKTGGPKRAHRLMWERFKGPIPAGMLLLHGCDNPGCVNVDHLRLGSAAENTADMLARHRELRGDLAPWTKIPDALIPEIRRRVAEGPRGTASKIASELGVTPGAISDIKLNRKRRTIPTR